MRYQVSGALLMVFGALLQTGALMVMPSLELIEAVILQALMAPVLVELVM